MPRLIAVVSIWMLLILTTSAMIRSTDGQLTVRDGDIAGGGSGDCPRQCSCLGGLIDCSEKGLKALFDIPSWVENLELPTNRLGYGAVQSQVANLNKLGILNLNHNNLGRIPTFRGLNNLIKLQVANNGIEAIDVEALQTLGSLRNLDLSRNSIKTIQYASFPSKNNLQFLSLNFNKLSTLTKGTFSRLPALRKLEINSNVLEEVQSLTFQNLNQLRTLKLNNNRITNLMDGVFHGLTTISVLELNNNSITSIRKGGLFNLTSLTRLELSKNAITEIEQDGWEFAPRLDKLDLSFNRLESIDKYTFEELSLLKELNLAGNQISSIGEGTFNNTRSLEVLDLGANRISWTIEDMKGPFYGLSNLKKLYLNSNEIKSVSRNAFIGLKSLTLIELSQNNISYIQNNAFKDTVQLNNLVMNSTNLLCDCNLVWFYNWIKERKDVFQSDAECSYPIWLRGQMIRDLTASNFSCYDSPKPHLIAEPRSQLGIRGTNVTLVCTATSTAADSMSFKWKQDNQELPVSSFTVSQINNPNGTVGTTELTIPYIQANGAGKYQCIIGNNYGTVYSAKVKVTVATFPSFKKTPSDISVQAGSTARLDCSAMGDPKPQIAWQKDGGNDFPAAKDRRMRVMPDEDAFFITNAQLVDMGVYTCTAENPAGVIRAKAMVEIFEAPVLMNQLVSQSTVYGKTSVIECMASGYPKPVIHWFKNGAPIEIIDRYFFTAEGQLFIIVDTDWSDAGDYECRMQNNFGSQTASMTLTVLEEPEKIPEIVDGDSGDKDVTTGHILHNQDLIMIVVITIFCCCIFTSLIWLVAMHRFKKQYTCHSTNHNGFDGGDIDMNSNMEANQQNLIVRSGVGISTTPAGYFEFLIPMVRNEATTNVDDDDRSHLTSRCYYTVVPKVPPKARRNEAESEDLDDDLSSKDSGTGGDCGSATGSTNNAHRGSHDDLKCLFQTLNRKTAQLGHPYQYDENDPDSDPRIEPPPPIPPVNATTAVLVNTDPSKIVYSDDLPPPIVSRMATSQTFPTFVHPSSNTPSSLVASSMEAAVSTQQQQPQPVVQQHPSQVQVNKLYQLLIENPRLLEKPAKYRSKSLEDETLSQLKDSAVDPSSSGIDSSSSSTLNRRELVGESSKHDLCQDDSDVRVAVR